MNSVEKVKKNISTQMREKGLSLIFLCRFYENTSLCNALSKPRSNLDMYLTFEFTFYPLHPENLVFPFLVTVLLLNG